MFFFIGSVWQELVASDDKTDRDISTSLKVMTRLGNLYDVLFFCFHFLFVKKCDISFFMFIRMCMWSA